MKKQFLLFTLVFFACNTSIKQPVSAVPTGDNIVSNKKNLIQIALLLDVSNSMDGLIGQAKTQLWSIVNEVAKATKHGDHTRLEIALYEYGRTNNDMEQGYVKQLLNYTSDLDAISQKLFGITTNGGDEYCGWVIDKSLDELKWTTDDSIYRVIFIAGNEPFTQGGKSYKTACLKAVEKNVIVNTIHCGDWATGVSEFWQDGAVTGKGEYFFINQNENVYDIATPYDALIQKYNDSLNTTYLSYGSVGYAAQANQVAQDENAKGMDVSVSVKRAESKASTVYNNSNWDVVDAVTTDSVFLKKTTDKDLPEELKYKSLAEKKNIVYKKSKQRNRYSANITQLSRKREEFIQQQMKTKPTNTLGNALIEAIRKQAKAKGFVFIDNK